MDFAAHGEGLPVGDIHDEVFCRGRAVFVGKSSEPPQGFSGVGRGGMPEAHGLEVRQAGVFVAAAVHHGHVALFV